jgi:hypothetical protein
MHACLATTAREEMPSQFHVLLDNSRSTTKLKSVISAHQATSAQTIHTHGLTQQLVTRGEQV